MSTKKRQQLRVEMADGAVYVVTIVNVDRVAFDKAAMLNDWRYPTREDPRGALLMQDYLAWHRLQKLGLYDKPYATFSEDAVDVDDYTPDDPAEAPEDRPTPPDQSPED